MDKHKLTTQGVAPIELEKITNSIKASLANLEKYLGKKTINDDLQEPKDLEILIQKQVELISINIAQLADIRMKHWTTRSNGELSHESGFEDQKLAVGSTNLDTPELTPSALSSEQTKKLIQGITLWQDMLQNSEILTRRKSNPLIDVIADNDIRTSFWRTLEIAQNKVSQKEVTSNLFEITNARTINTQNTTECWRAFWKSLEGSDAVNTDILLKIEYHIRAITNEHKPVTSNKYVVNSNSLHEENPCRDAQESHAADNRTNDSEAFSQIWAPIKREWHHLRRYKKRLKQSRFYEEDFESYETFQRRTGSIKIATDQLAIRKERLEMEKKKEDEAATLGDQEAEETTQLLSTFKIHYHSTNSRPLSQMTHTREKLLREWLEEDREKKRKKTKEDETTALQWQKNKETCQPLNSFSVRCHGAGGRTPAQIIRWREKSLRETRWKIK